MLSINNFKDFEVYANNVSKTQELDFNNGICVIRRDPISEFGEFSGIQLKKTYLVNRIIECSIANMSKKLNIPAFKLVSGDENIYVFVNDPKKTKMFNDKLYMSFKLKQDLQNQYNADKVFTLRNTELNSMYREDQEHLTQLEMIWN